MNIFQRYVAYLKDNPNRYWFRRKLWGWGWTPATREGWAITLGFIAIIVGLAFFFEKEINSGGDTRLFFATIIALITFFIIVVWRTGEPPKWQWGFPKKEEK